MFALVSNIYIFISSRDHDLSLGIYKAKNVKSKRKPNAFDSEDDQVSKTFAVFSFELF